MSTGAPLDSCDDGGDPLSPPPPQSPRFDPVLAAWVLSRYADVLAALREPRLYPMSAEGGHDLEARDEGVRWELRRRTSEAFSTQRLETWQAQITPLAQSFAERLATDRPVDLVAEFAHPWSLRLAAIVTGAEAGECQRLAEFARQVSAATAEPRDSELQSAAAAASAELERSLPEGMPMRASAFVALSQTLPCFLATACYALLRNPVVLEELRSEPQLMPKAIEELLRYAGLARILFRWATMDLDVGAIRIRKGERLALMLASANRDPAQFPEPNRLVLRRNSSGQLALGAGPHSCVAASLIRMAATVAAGVFLHKFGEAKLCAPVVWRGGSGFRWPAPLYVA